MTLHGSTVGDAQTRAGTINELFGAKTGQLGRVWTPEYLAYVLPLAPEDILVRQSNSGTGASPSSRREWRLIDLAQRLTWRWGPEEAIRRLNAPAEPPAPELIAA